MSTMNPQRMLAAAALGALLAGCGRSAEPIPLAPYDAGGPEEPCEFGKLGDTNHSETAPSDTGSADAADPATPSSASWQCPTAAEVPCGGALEGTRWSIVDFCPEDPAAAAALFEHPFDDLPACQPPGSAAAGQLVDTGEIAFQDGQIVMDIGGYAQTTYTFSAACLAAVKPGAEPAVACASLAKPGVMTCSLGPGAGTCICEAKVPKEGGKSTLPYAIVGGTTLKVGTEFSADYCVQGERLLLDVSPHIVSWRWWLLKRK